VSDGQRAQVAPEAAASEPEDAMTYLVYDGGRAWDKLVWGVVLIALGVFFLLARFGFVPSHLMGTWWPILVIAAGTGSLLCARSPRKIGSAVNTLGLGAWLMIAANGWYGLGWSRSWPLALVAAGLGSLTQALAQSVWPRKEDVHVG
jgi:hypothetical protein